MSCISPSKRLVYCIGLIFIAGYQGGYAQATAQESCGSKKRASVTDATERLIHGLAIPHPDPKFFSTFQETDNDRIFVEPRIVLQKKAQMIHSHLVSAYHTCTKFADGSHMKTAAQMLNKDTEQPIIHLCATLEQRRRKNGECSTIWIKDSIITHMPFKIKADTFYQNTCCFDTFYQSLSDSELKHLQKATAPAGFFKRLAYKMVGQ